jgi:hypothetical protein
MPAPPRAVLAAALRGVSRTRALVVRGRQQAGGRGRGRGGRGADGVRMQLGRRWRGANGRAAARGTSSRPGGRRPSPGEGVATGSTTATASSAASCQHAGAAAAAGRHAAAITSTTSTNATTTATAAHGQNACAAELGVGYHARRRHGRRRIVLRGLNGKLALEADALEVLYMRRQRRLQLRAQGDSDFTAAAMEAALWRARSRRWKTSPCLTLSWTTAADGCAGGRGIRLSSSAGTHRSTPLLLYAASVRVLPARY